MNGAAPNPTDALAGIDRRWKCEICQHESETTAALHIHLHEAHRLPTNDWQPSRDTLHHMPICRHCNRDFSTMANLRSHVTLGYCPSFDPERSSEPLPLDERWTLALRMGTVQDLVQQPEIALELSLQCQCCGDTFTRAQDIAAHLQMSHGAVWCDAQPWIAMLVEQLMPITGCVCSPSYNGNTLQH